MTKQVVFDQQDLDALCRLFDAAVRSGGLEAAIVALPLFNKINNAPEYIPEVQADE